MKQLTFDFIDDNDGNGNDGVPVSGIHETKPSRGKPSRPRSDALPPCTHFTGDRALTTQYRKPFQRTPSPNTMPGALPCWSGPIGGANETDGNLVIRAVELTAEHRLAWAAGLIDGDGCISTVRQPRPDRPTPEWRIRLDVSQNDVFTLEQVCRALSGISCHLNAVKRKPEHTRQPYLLTYDGRHAVQALTQLRPFLVRKQAEADACIALFREGQMGKRFGAAGVPLELLHIRERWHQRLKRLK